MFIIAGILFFIFCLTYISTILLVTFLPWAIIAHFFGIMSVSNRQNLWNVSKIVGTFVFTGLYLHYLSDYEMYKFVETIEKNINGVLISLGLLHLYCLGFLISTAKDKYRGLKK